MVSFHGERSSFDIKNIKGSFKPEEKTLDELKGELQTAAGLKKGIKQIPSGTGSDLAWERKEGSEKPIRGTEKSLGRQETKPFLLKELKVSFSEFLKDFISQLKGKKSEAAQAFSKTFDKMTVVSQKDINKADIALLRTYITQIETVRVALQAIRESDAKAKGGEAVLDSDARSVLDKTERMLVDAEIRIHEKQSELAAPANATTSAMKSLNFATRLHEQLTFIKDSIQDVKTQEELGKLKNRFEGLRTDFEKEAGVGIYDISPGAIDPKTLKRMGVTQDDLNNINMGWKSIETRIANKEQELGIKKRSTQKQAAEKQAAEEQASEKQAAEKQAAQAAHKQSAAAKHAAAEQEEVKRLAEVTVTPEKGGLMTNAPNRYTKAAQDAVDERIIAFRDHKLNKGKDEAKREFANLLKTNIKQAINDASVKEGGKKPKLKDNEREALGRSIDAYIDSKISELLS